MKSIDKVRQNRITYKVGPGPRVPRLTSAQGPELSCGRPRLRAVHPVEASAALFRESFVPCGKAIRKPKIALEA